MFTLRKLSFYTLAALTLVGCENSKTEKKANIEAEKTEKTETSANLDINKVSQALGNFIGRNINTPGIHFDLESLIKGVREGAAGKPSPMNEEEYQAAMTELQQQAFATISVKNLDEAEKFLKENVKASGIVEIIPGKLQYKILEEGHGSAVEEHGSPQLVYVGTYLDGNVFGNSGKTPLTAPLDQTIPGFSQGVIGMKEGEKRRLFVHPDLGYGTNGQLPPNSLLIFDVEVLKANGEGQVATSEEERESLDDQAFDEEETTQQQQK